MSIYTKILSCRCKSGLFNSLKLCTFRVYLLKQPSVIHKRTFNSLSTKIIKNSHVNKQILLPKNSILLYFRSNATKATKTKLNKTDVYRLLSLAKPEKWKLLGAVALLFVSSTVSMAVPFSLGKVLDIIYSNPNDLDDARNKLRNICGILIGVFLIGALCNFGRIYLMSSTGYRMTQALRLQTFSSILKQEQSWFDTRSTGELINRLSLDTQLVGQSLTSNISDGLRSTIMVLTGSGMMIYTSPQLAMFGLAIVPPIAGLAVVYGRFVRKLTKSVQETLAQTAQVASERISNIRTVKMFSREAKELDAYAKSINKVLQLGYKETKARAMFYGLTGLSGNLIIISVLYYGGVMVSTQSLTIGSLSSFLMYAAYIGVSIGGLSSFYSELNKSVGAAAALWEIIDRKPLMVSKGIIPSNYPEGHVTFKNIDFKYPSRSDVEIFNNLQLDISPGQTIAIVGRSGSGKSTLAALLLRLYDPVKGNVYLDGQDIKNLDPIWLRRQIGAVSQEPILFSSTIRDNILYGTDEPGKITEEEFLRVAKEANVYEFVENLPNKFNTVVGERGILLSGGQKQRVAIARALIKNPKILVLDEATSALDSQSEHLVQDALMKAMKGRTVLTIAHRLSTIQSADYIAVIKNGAVIERGTYEDLLKLENGAFKLLMQHQI